MVTPPPIQLANIGMADSLIIMVLALVVFGPRRLPQIGRQIGKLMYEFRKASNDFKFQMEEELRASEETDRRAKEEAERQRVAALTAQSQASVSAPAQTVESVADVGAVEMPTPPGYPEPYPAETSSGDAGTVEGAPVIQPPSTGETVSAGEGTDRPEYYFPASQPAATSEVNPDADVAANAEEFAVGGGLEKESRSSAEPDPHLETPISPESATSPEAATGPEAATSPEAASASGTTAKETVGQHG